MAGTNVAPESVDRNRFSPHRAAALGLPAMLIGTPAYAYLGPGAGLGMIGSLIAIVFVLLVIVLGLVVYPIRRMRKRKNKTADPTSRVDP